MLRGIAREPAGILSAQRAAVATVRSPDNEEKRYRGLVCLSSPEPSAAKAPSIAYKCTREDFAWSLTATSS